MTAADEHLDAPPVWRHVLLFQVGGSKQAHGLEQNGLIVLSSGPVLLGRQIECPMDLHTTSPLFCRCHNRSGAAALHRTAHASMGALCDDVHYLISILAKIDRIMYNNNCDARNSLSRLGTGPHDTRIDESWCHPVGMVIK